MNTTIFILEMFLQITEIQLYSTNSYSLNAGNGSVYVKVYAYYIFK